MSLLVRRLWSSEDGATAVEYAVLLGLILMAIIAAVGAVGAQNGGMWGGIDSKLDDVM